MKRIDLKQIIASIFIGLILASCGTNPGFQQADNGVLYQVHYQGTDSIQAEDLDWVTVHMDYRLEDTLLFSSHTLNAPFEFPIGKAMFVGDVYDGLKLMHVGDSMTFKIVADSFYYKTASMTTLPDFVEAGSPMYFDVKLLKSLSETDYLAEKHEEEEAYIQEYLAANELTIHPLKSGLYFYPLKAATGRRPDTGDMCRVVLTVKLLDGTLLYSNEESGDPLEVEFGKEFDTEGFMEGLSMLREGGKALLIVPSKIGVGSTGKNGVAPFTPVQYEIQLARLATVAQVKAERKQRKLEREKEIERRRLDEASIIKKYIKDNKIGVVPSESGLYFIETDPGNGAYAQAGDSVWVNYRLYDLDGKEYESSYESNDPFRFPLGKNEVIKGWEEALLKMRKGGKATIIIPSSLAYGKRRLRNGIEPYTPLVYDLEIMEIKP